MLRLIGRRKFGGYWESAINCSLGSSTLYYIRLKGERGLTVNPRCSRDRVTLRLLSRPADSVGIYPVLSAGVRVSVAIA